MSPIRTALAALLLAATLSTTGCDLVRQTSLLDKTRRQYYSLSDAGVSEFHCDVTPDWTAFLTSVNHKTPADTPWHHYLQQASLHFSAPLTGKTTVQWSAPSAVPAGFETSAQQMQTSFHDMVAGFLEAWIPSLNNTLLPDSHLSHHAQRRRLLPHRARSGEPRHERHPGLAVAHHAPLHQSPKVHRRDRHEVCSLARRSAAARTRYLGPRNRRSARQPHHHARHLRDGRRRSDSLQPADPHRPQPDPHALQQLRSSALRLRCNESSGRWALEPPAPPLR